VVKTFLKLGVLYTTAQKFQLNKIIRYNSGALGVWAGPQEAGFFGEDPGQRSFAIPGQIGRLTGFTACSLKEKRVKKPGNQNSIRTV
jgi:hypothetical protein